MNRMTMKRLAQGEQTMEAINDVKIDANRVKKAKNMTAVDVRTD